LIDCIPGGQGRHVNPWLVLAALGCAGDEEVGEHSGVDACNRASPALARRRHECDVARTSACATVFSPLPAYAFLGVLDDDAARGQLLADLVGPCEVARLAGLVPLGDGSLDFGVEIPVC